MDEEVKERWNRAAAHYQATVREENGGYPDRLMEFLWDAGALRPGCYVADIGCGAGKYAIRFAGLGCGLLLLDIADHMMAYTKENLASVGVSAEFAVCDWAEVDLAARGWEKSVDLAFASMTPAVETRADLQKLSAMSRGFCFVSKFVEMDNLLCRQAAKLCGAAPPDVRAREDPLALLRWLLEDGYLPAVRFDPYGWENVYSPREAEAALRESEWGAALPAGRLREALVALAGADGMVRETVRAKTMWLLWDVSKK